MRDLHHAEESAAVCSGWSGYIHCRDPDRPFWDRSEECDSVTGVGAEGESGCGREPHRELPCSGGHLADSGESPVSSD